MKQLLQNTKIPVRGLKPTIAAAVRVAAAVPSKHQNPREGIKTGIEQVYRQ